MTEASAPGRAPLLFRQVAVLDSVQHRQLRRRPRESYGFAITTNAVPLGFAELARAALEYPVVFAGEGEGIHLAAVVGLTVDRNLQVDQSGRWRARYIPAYLRGFPFAAARLTGAVPDRFHVVIDPTSNEFSAADGQALFDEAGQPTTYLTQIVEFLKQFDAQMRLASRFAKRVDQLGLLRQVTADVRLRGGQQFALSGLRVVDRATINSLSAIQRAELVGDDTLESIFLHLASLQNFSILVDRLARHEPTAPETA